MKPLGSSSASFLSLTKAVRIINILVWLPNKSWLAFKQVYKCFIVSSQNENQGWAGYSTWQDTHWTSNATLWCSQSLRSQSNKNVSFSKLLGEVTASSLSNSWVDCLPYKDVEKWPLCLQTEMALSIWLQGRPRQSCAQILILLWLLFYLSF